MKKRKYFAAIMSLVILMQQFSVITCFSAEETNENVYVNEIFDGTVTNKAPESMTVSSGNIRVIAEGTANKALLLYGNSETTADFGQEVTFKDAVLSFEIRKYSDKKTNFTMGFYESASKVMSSLININDDVIKTVDGKKVGTIKNDKYTKIQLLINNRKNIYDIYIDGKCVVKQWKLSRSVIGKLTMKRYMDGEKGDIVLDNIKLYDAKSVAASAPINNTVYNIKEDAFIDYSYDKSDFCFVDTDYLSDLAWDSSGCYGDTAWNQKTNKITFNRLKYRNDPNRPNNHIIFEKTTPSDSAVDFYIAARRPVYPYYLIEGSLQVNKFGSVVRFSYIADTYTNASRVDFEIMYVNEEGQLVVSSTGQVLKNLAEDEWFSYKIVLDTYGNCADIYINDVLTIEKLPYRSDADRPTFVRHTMNSVGNGMATFDGIRVVGMMKKYDPNGNDRTNFFGDDSGIEEYMKDKVGFFAHGKQVCSYGTKHSRLDKKPEFDKENGELYVTALELSKGYGLNLEIDGETARAEGIVIKADDKTVKYNGKEYTLEKAPYYKEETLYIPVAEFAEKVLGHHVFKNDTGLFITSPNKFDIDTSKDKPEAFISANEYPYPYTNARVIEWYLTYERPTAETIKEDFNKATNNGAVHPRIIMNQDEFDKLREKIKTDEVLKGWLDKVISATDSRLDKHIFTYSFPDKQRMDGNARDWQGLDMFAFAYQMTGEQKYVDAAWRVISELGTFPDWNPSHIIDPAEINAYVGLAYDWMYDAWTPEQREFIYKVVKEKGLNDVYDAHTGRLGGGPQWTDYSDKFVDWKSNFNTLVNGGAICAAAAFAEQDPDFCFELISKCIRSFEFTMINFAPCGIWAEGMGYWDYANNALTKGLGAVYSSTGQHYGLLDAQGVDQTALFYRSMDSYGGMNNFHDASEGRASSSYVGWYAKVFNQPELTLLKKKLIMQGRAWPSHWDLIYYPVDFEGDENNLEYDYYFEGLEVVASRGSYTNDDEMYFSSHAGWVESYHTQYDVGTFVFDMLGYRWASDLGREDYNVRRDGTATAYRDRAEGHNVMVFDPTSSYTQGQVPSGWGYLDKYETKDRGMYVSYDLTTCYKEVSKYLRGFYVGDDRRSLTIRDEFTSLGNIDAYWFLHTPAEVEVIDNNTAIMSLGSKKMKVDIVTTAKSCELSVVDARPLSVYPVLENENENEGFRKIQLKLETKSNTPTTVTVKLSPLGEKASETGIMNIPISEWTIPDGEYKERPNLGLETIYVNGRNIGEIETNGKVTIVEGEPIPEITAVPVDKDSIVEIIQGTPADAYTIVRVWDKNKTIYQDTQVLYAKSKSANLTSYEKNTIKSVIVSSTPEAANHKDNIIDGDFTTRWTTMAVGEWALFDLGEVKDIDAISIAHWRGNERIYKFSILTSEDGDTWTEVANTQNSGETEGNELVEFERQKARYIKFVGGGNTVNANSNILEFAALTKK